MVDEYKARIDAERAARAEVLMRDELLVEAFATLEAEYFAFWKDSGALDTTAREKVWQAAQIVGKVRRHLTTVIVNGQLAAADLKHLTS